MMMQPHEHTDTQHTLPSQPRHLAAPALVCGRRCTWRQYYWNIRDWKL